jgi:tripartite-type tricarboxylate transporter receptor subunit TctC
MSVASLSSPLQAAPSWPNKSVRLIVPYPPGGSSDIIARVISEPLSEALKQKVVVENKAGANGNLGAEAVAKTDPDGHMLLLCDVGALAISPSVYTKLTFNPSRDLRGVTMLAYSPHLLVVHPSVKASNLQELVQLSKTTPMNLAVSAIGSAPHLAAVAIQQATGANWQYIPYKGGAQAIADTVAGQTQILVNGALATLSFVNSGKLRAIGVSKKTRMPLIGQMPTLAEQGVSNFESGSWQGILAGPNLPAAALERLNGELIRVIRLPEVREKLSGQGAEIVTQTPAEFVRFFEGERKRWADVVAKANVRLD